MSQYRFIPRNKINPQKWDACIQASTDLPYALYWYLDIVSEKNWSALILRDYEAVFPVVWSKKLGLKYVYQPFFCQQLGLFSPEPHPLFESTCLRFLQRKFIYSALNLHHDSIAESSKLLSIRPNFVLPLESSYEQIHDSYSKNTHRNLAKSKLHKLIFKPFHDAKKFAQAYAASSGANTKGYNQKHTLILEHLINATIERKMGEIGSAYADENNPPVALCFMLHSKNRIINLAPVTPKGTRETGGMTFLIDYYIKQYARTEKLLDFEGSAVETIARFYKGFGAKPEPFWQYKHTFFDVVKQPFLPASSQYK